MTKLNKQYLNDFVELLEIAETPGDLANWTYHGLLLLQQHNKLPDLPTLRILRDRPIKNHKGLSLRNLSENAKIVKEGLIAISA